jgi:hypothetical protein
MLLDFRPRPRFGGLLGSTMLLAGFACACATGVVFARASASREALELRLGALTSAHEHRVSAADTSRIADAAPLLRELAAPWSLLLQELETASRDVGGTVAVLAVEPDRDKGKLRVTAEAKDLNEALTYIERLQKSQALKFPMLDSHEIRSDDKDQPVRFQLSAEWRVQ